MRLLFFVDSTSIRSFVGLSLWSDVYSSFAVYNQPLDFRPSLPLRAHTSAGVGAYLFTPEIRWHRRSSIDHRCRRSSIYPLAFICSTSHLVHMVRSQMNLCPLRFAVICKAVFGNLRTKFKSTFTPHSWRTRPPLQQL